MNGPWPTNKKREAATTQLSNCKAGKGKGKRKTPRGTANIANIKNTPTVQATYPQPIEGLRQEGLDWHEDWHDVAKYREDTKKYMSGRSCKEGKVFKGYAYAEGKNMSREDSLSGANRIYDGEGQRGIVPIDPIPLPKFQTGQSCIQWWAKWMSNAAEVPASYNRKSRPAWFPSEINTYIRYGAIKYCGIMQVPQHLYDIRGWDGHGETVPEMFISAREPGASSLHSNGRLEPSAQGPAPELLESFNSSNANATK